MKVLYIIDTLETGGAERSLLEIASRLTSFTPIVCHLYQGETLKSKFEEAGIRVISLNLKGPYQFVAAYFKLKRICILEKPDLVISALYRSEIVARLVGWRLNILQVGSFVSDSYSVNKKSTFTFYGRIKFKIFYWLNRLTSPLSFAYIANSESIKISNSESLRIPTKKIKVIYRGRPVIPNSIVPRAINAELIKFLNVGRLIMGKGQSELIRAFAIFHTVHQASRLTIAGEGPYRNTLESLIASLNLTTVVTLLGNVEGISTLYDKHDCLVFPSHYEGFSGVLVEAMLHELPILASDIPMNKEAIRHMETGYIFNVKNETSMVEAMQWFMGNKRTALDMAKVAREQALHRFDIEIIAKQHEDLYKELLLKFSQR